MILVYICLSRIRSTRPWRQEFILKLNAVVAYTCMVHHTCISFNANFCSFSMVRSCAMSSNRVWLQIIFCSCINETTLFSFFAITLAWKCRLLRFPKIFVKNKLGNQMIKQFLNSVIVKYYDLSASKPKAEAIDLLNLVQYLLIIIKRLTVLHKTIVLNDWLLLLARGGWKRL